MKVFIAKYIKGDRVVWTVVVFLMIASLLAVYSSTGALAYSKKGGDTSFYVMKHFGMLAMSFLAMVVVHRINPRYFAGLAHILLGIGVITLLAALVVGTRTNGAARWLNLGFISFQPSEFAKLALIIFVARQLALYQTEKDTRKAFKSIVIALGLVCGLIFMENLSTALLTGGTVVILMMLGRMPFSRIAGLSGALILLVVLVLIIPPPYNPIPRAHTWQKRVERYLSGEKKENADGNFQMLQAKMAIATGGVIGKGPGNSYYRNFLPMAFSDFIFAIILEEYGIIGGILVILSYIVLLARAAMIARRSDRPFHILLVLGMTLLLVLQAFVNISVCVGVIPVTGQTLPLVSMGGTSNILTGMAIGTILAVSRFNDEEAERKQEEKKAAKAVKNEVAVVEG